MPRKPGGSWVVMGPEPHFAHCTRCGGIVPPPVMPCPVDAFVKYGAYVVELHRRCLPRPTEIPEEDS